MTEPMWEAVNQCGLCLDLGHLFIDEPDMPCPWCAPDDYEPRLRALAERIHDAEAAEVAGNELDEPVPYVLTDAALTVLAARAGRWESGR